MDILFLFCLLAISITDIKHRRIPDWCVIAVAVLAFVSLLVRKDTLGIADIGNILIGAVCVSGFLVLTDLIVPGAFGGGDIKLAAAGGLYLGMRLIIVSAVLAFILAGIYILVRLVVQRFCAGDADKMNIHRQTELPFGPFLSIGMTVSLLWGEWLINWYICSPFY